MDNDEQRDYAEEAYNRNTQLTGDGECWCQYSPGDHRILNPVCPVHGVELAGQARPEGDGVFALTREQTSRAEELLAEMPPASLNDKADMLFSYGVAASEAEARAILEHLHEEDGNPDNLQCIDDHKPGGCRGTVLNRMSLTGTGTPIPRCDKHWQERLEFQEQHNQVYPDSPIPPAWFDPEAAGERWDDD